MSLLAWTGIAEATTTPSIGISSDDQRKQEANWHAFVSLSGTAPTGIQVSYSPDLPSTTDANSKWYAPTALLFTAAGDTFFQAKFRKARVEVTGGDGTTSVNVTIL